MLGTAFAAGATVGQTSEPSRGRPAKLEVALDFGFRAAVEPRKNPLSILLGNPVQQLVMADSSRFGPDARLSQQRHHCISKVAAVDNTHRRPDARAPNPALLTPAPHNDDEISLAQDRDCIVAGSADDFVYRSPMACSRARRADARLGAPP